MTARAALLVLAAAACGDMGKDPSLIDGPRVLAMRAVPRSVPTSGDVALEALVVGSTGAPEWSACATDWLPADALVCPAGAATLGSGSPLVADAATLQAAPNVAIALPDARPAVLRLATDSTSQPAFPHPEVTALVTDTGPLPATVAPGATLVLVPETTNPATTERVATFLATDGGIEPYRTITTDTAATRLTAATWTAPDTAGPVTLYVVVRDTAGGVGWRSAAIDVVAP